MPTTAYGQRAGRRAAFVSCFLAGAPLGRGPVLVHQVCDVARFDAEVAAGRSPSTAGSPSPVNSSASAGGRAPN